MTKAFSTADLLVVGSGPSGLAAALAAGRAGLRVILCDEDFQLGGRLNAETYEVDGQAKCRLGRLGPRRARRHARAFA